MCVCVWGGGGSLGKGERKEAPGEAACHLNNTLDTFNLPEHKREGFKARKHTQCPWSPR